MCTRTALLRFTTTIMSKRMRSSSGSDQVDAADSKISSTGNHSSPSKRTKKFNIFIPNKIATAQSAAKVDHDQPFFKLLEELEKTVKSPNKGDAVVYWMRMEDLRSAFPLSPLQILW